MSLLAIEGVYRDGRVELAEQPDGVQSARVVVTFLPSEEQHGEEARQAAIARLLARMDAGIDFGGSKFDRTAIYEERMRELDSRREPAS